MDSPPLTSLRQKFGGVLVKDYRAVTPPMVSSVESLLMSFFDVGLTSAVVSAYKVEHSLHRCLAQNHLLSGGDNVEKLVLCCSSHLQAVLTMLRNFHREAQNPWGPRQFPKSGGFRKRMAYEHWAILEKLTSRISPDAPSRESSVGLSHASSRTSLASENAIVELTDDGYPAVFKPFFRSDAMEEPEPAPLQLVPSPRSPSPRSPWSTGTQWYPAAQTDEPEPVCPHPKRRKQLALKGEIKTPQKKTKASPKPSPQKTTAPVHSDVDGLPIERSKLFVTKEASPRGEITAWVQKKRIHLATFTFKKYGEVFKDHAKALHDRVQDGRITTKTQALAFKQVIDAPQH